MQQNRKEWMLNIFNLHNNKTLIKIMWDVHTVEGSLMNVNYSILNIEVAERHIPKCKNIINKPKPVPKRNE